MLTKHCGWLDKLSDWLKIWRNRYCEFDGTSLTFSIDEQSQPHYKIDLTLPYSVRIVLFHGRRALAIRQGYSVFYLCGHKHDDNFRWFDVLHYHSKSFAPIPPEKFRHSNLVTSNSHSKRTVESLFCSRTNCRKYYGVKVDYTFGCSYSTYRVSVESTNYPFTCLLIDYFLHSPIEFTVTEATAQLLKQQHNTALLTIHVSHDYLRACSIKCALEPDSSRENIVPNEKSLLICRNDSDSRLDSSVDLEGVSVMSSAATSTDSATILSEHPMFDWPNNIAPVVSFDPPLSFCGSRFQASQLPTLRLPLYTQGIPIDVSMLANDHSTQVYPDVPPSPPPRPPLLLPHELAMIQCSESWSFPQSASIRFGGASMFRRSVRGVDHEPGVSSPGGADCSLAVLSGCNGHRSVYVVKLRNLHTRTIVPLTPALHSRSADT